MISENELLDLMSDTLNAISHRNYESNAPVRFHRFVGRLEINNPGGL